MSDEIVAWRRWDVDAAAGAHRTAAWTERDIDDPTATFGELLYCLRVGIGLSTLALSRAAGVSTGFVRRLESGEQAATTDEVVLALADVLQATPIERDRLLYIASYRPQKLPLPRPDATISDVTEAMACGRCPSPLYADVHASVESIARRWRRPDDGPTGLEAGFLGDVIERSTTVQMHERGS